MFFRKGGLFVVSVMIVSRETIIKHPNQATKESPCLDCFFNCDVFSKEGLFIVSVVIVSRETIVFVYS